ncbi:MAG: HD domain-containing protein [Bacilli bacterium]|nr:HD domain-containing protein [Bacilli bacterium]
MKNGINEFLNYTKNYLDYGEMIKLKINHTLRVVDLCEYLAKSLNLDKEKTKIAKVIGLLHDIGRFEQWKNYQTFKDMDSIDHADLAVDILKNNNYLRKFIKDDKYDSIILDSIKYHNKFTLPNDLDNETLLFTKLIRDADKLDILYLYVDKEIDLELDEEEFSSNVYETLLRGETMNRKEIKTKTDRLSVSLGFVYDINFKESFQYLKEKNYYDTIIKIYQEKTKNEILKEQLEKIKKEINHYIEVKIC